MLENYVLLRIIGLFIVISSVFSLFYLRNYFMAQMNPVENILFDKGVVISSYLRGFWGGFSSAELVSFYKTGSLVWDLELSDMTTNRKLVDRLSHRNRLCFKENRCVSIILHLRNEFGLQKPLEENDVIDLIKLIDFGFRRDKGVFQQTYNLKNYTVLLDTKSVNFIPIKIDVSDRLSDFGFNRPLNCFVATADLTDPLDCENLKSKIEQVGHIDRYLILFVPKPIPAGIEDFIRDKIEKVLARDVVIVTLDDLYKFIVARDINSIVRKFFIAQIDLTKISPFTLTGPTTEQMFFGREQEIRLILENIGLKSYAVVGGRRIGKSSILLRLHKVMLPAVGFYSAYIDFATVSSYEEFLKKKIHAMNPTMPVGFPATFEELLNLNRYFSEQRVVLLIDEADKIVINDKQNKWKIFKTLRSLANSGLVHIVLSGEQALREAIRDSSSPLFNFTDEIILHPLDRQSVDELVTKSMKQLEITLVEREKLIDMIVTFTSGHPNIVQRLCHRLIEFINKKGIRIINSDLVNEILNDPTFQRDDFLSTIWELSTPLEKILSLLMVENPTARTNQSLRDLVEKRAKMIVRPKEIDSALQRLVDLRSIIRRTKDGYEFSVEAFPKVVAGTITLNDMLAVFVDEYKLEQGK